MIGAIIGDIVGSRFERANHKSTDFELFTKECHFTDDTVMTLESRQGVFGFRSKISGTRCKHAYRV